MDYSAFSRRIDHFQRGAGPKNYSAKFFRYSDSRLRFHAADSGYLMLVLLALRGTAAAECDTDDYYADVDLSLTGSALRAALHARIKSPHTVIPYTSSATDVWDALKVIDADPSQPGQRARHLFAAVDAGLAERRQRRLEPRALVAEELWSGI